MPATVNYFEIGTPDPETSQRFYSGLFGWTVDEPSPVGYRMVADGTGGMWDTSRLGGESWGIFYVQVDDVQTTLDEAESLGAKVLLPLTDNGAIEFAHLADPHGNRFGVWRPKASDGTQPQ